MCESKSGSGIGRQRENAIRIGQGTVRYGKVKYQKLSISRTLPFSSILHSLLSLCLSLDPTSSSDRGTLLFLAWRPVRAT